jgi:hypothetical protein
MRCNMGPNSVERFLAALRDSVPNAVEVFTNGNCFKLFRLLRTVYPQANPYYRIVAGHVYTEIDGDYYDIEGKVIFYGGVKWGWSKEQLTYMLDEPRIFKSAFRWQWEPPLKSKGHAMLHIPDDIEAWVNDSYVNEGDETEIQAEMFTALSTIAKQLPIAVLDYDYPETGSVVDLAFNIIGESSVPAFEKFYAAVIKEVDADEELDIDDLFLYVRQVRNDGMFDSVEEDALVPVIHLTYSGNEALPKDWARVKLAFHTALLNTIEKIAKL